MILAVIQARMGSTRLPGKVLKEINGKPLLSYQIDRLAYSEKIDKIVVATSDLARDDEIVDFCIANNIDYFRGSENDVLTRYFECASIHKPETVVRLTADCPLCDPKIVDSVISKFQESGVDYCANTVPMETSCFPDGSDVEVFSMRALERANSEVSDKHFREHVTFQFWQDKGYKSTQLLGNKDYSKYRITVDYPEDFEVVTYVFNELKRKGEFGHLNEVIDIIDSNDGIKSINSEYYFGQGWSK